MVSRVTFSSDGRFALTGSADKTVRLWDVASGKELRRFAPHTSGVWAVALSPNSRYALSGENIHLKDGKWVSGDDFSLKLWDVETNKQVRRFEGHTAGITSVVFSPDGNKALSGGHDGTVRLWEVETGKELHRFEGHTGWVYGVAFSPDGGQVLSGSSDRTLRLWDVKTKKPIRQFEGHTDAVMSVALSPNGRWALSASKDKTVRVWDVKNGEQRKVLAHPDKVFAVAFSPDSRFALSGGGDNFVRLWNTETGKEVQHFEGHTATVEDVAFSPDGRRAISGSWDRTARLWKLPDLESKSSTRIPEPPPLGEWLKGRKVITVAQDGSGNYRTISGALAKVLDGQAIEVLDKGPYVESLRCGLPANVGLFSRVRTSVVIPDWSQGGCSLSCADGFRLAGFNIVAPVVPKELESSDVLHIRGSGDIVVEGCRIIYDPQVDRPPPWRDGPVHDDHKAIRFTPISKMRATIQDNHLEATIRFGDEFDGEILVQRNRILVYQGIVTPKYADRIVIRHNFIHAGNSIVWNTLEPEEAATTRDAPHLICNNVLDSTHPPMLVRIKNVGHRSNPDDPPMAAHVWVMNNVLRAAFSGGILVAKADWETLQETWRVDYNCYLNGTRDFGHVISIPLGDHDRVLSSPYLSLDATDASYYRIREDTELGVSGAGTEIIGLPKYIGPLPPGPAPKEGDWFTELLAADREAREEPG
ncbi:MAG: hypothetical protein IH987_08560 [Planctomycetes bacterium]|nr:hypothetical protein [Planctomycetota bacterium]